MESILFISLNTHGGHITDPYSKMDRTSALYKGFKHVIF